MVGGRDAGSILVAAVAAGGCGPGAEDWPFDWPRVEDLEYVEQPPQRPADLVFRFVFTDGDGDLAAGSLELEVDEQVTARADMATLFAAQSPPLSVTSTRGAIQLIVELARELEPSERVRVGLGLEDAEGHRSNRPWVVLEARGDAD